MYGSALCEGNDILAGGTEDALNGLASVIGIVRRDDDSRVVNKVLVG